MLQAIVRGYNAKNKFHNFGKLSVRNRINVRMMQANLSISCKLQMLLNMRLRNVYPYTCYTVTAKIY